ncbi:MAG: hypothetical protein NDF54_09065 [archaeon GB-1867-035]|nr:hypothetical protein [Candidatus Culexmicrobium profundum]
MKQVINPLIENETLIHEIYDEIGGYIENSYLSHLIRKELESKNKETKIRIIYLWL